MDYFFFQIMFNSVLGVGGAMLVIARLIPQPRKNLLPLSAIFLFYFVANLWFLTKRYDLAESCVRAVFVASIFLLWGYVWSLVLAKNAKSGTLK